MSRVLNAALTAGPRYAGLYERLEAFRQQPGCEVRLAFSAPDSELNAQPGELRLADRRDPPAHGAGGCQRDHLRRRDATGNRVKDRRMRSTALWLVCFSQK